MAESNTLPNQLLLVNGQALLVKDVSTLNQLQLLCQDDLNQQYQLINPQIVNSIRSNSEESTELDTSENAFLNRLFKSSGEDESNEQKELITVLRTENNLEGPRSISLTLEQAAQLGLQFDVNTIDDSNLEDSSSTNIDNVSFLGTNGIEDEQVNTIHDDCSQLIDPSSMSSERVNAENYLELGSQNNSDSDVLEKSIFLNTTYSSDNLANQHVRLVSQMINGVLTYAILPSEDRQINEENHSNDQMYAISETPIIVSNELEHDRMDLDSNHSSTTDQPITNTSIGITQIPKENASSLILKPFVNSCSTDNTMEGLGFTLCNSQNKSYLNATGEIPSETNSLRSSVTDDHANRLLKTQQSQLVTITKSNILDSNAIGLKPLRLAMDRKVIANERQSVLLKQMNILPQKGDNLQHVGISKSSVNSKLNNYVFKQFEIGGKMHTVISENESLTNGDVEDSNENSSYNEIVPLNVPQTTSSVDENNKSSADPAVTATILTPSEENIPEEVSAVFSSLPIKSNDKMPVGSGENPIKLFQRGSIFHSIQELTADQISKIKPILQEKFDTNTPNENVVYDPTSNTRIIYRLISPSDLKLRRNGELPRKRGRPRKLNPEQQSTVEEVAAPEEPPVPKKVFSRTRSGRLSRPPKHMVRDFKHLKRPKLGDLDGASSDYQSENEDDQGEPPSSAVPFDLLPGLVARRTLKRNISKENVCPTCKKVYLGYDRMKRHFDNFPDHGSIEFLNAIRNNSNPDSEAEGNRVNGTGSGLNKKGRKRKGGFTYYSSTEKRTRLKQALAWCGSSDLAELVGPAVAKALSLWELLLLRVGAASDQNRVTALYRELRLLLTKLRNMAKQLFRPLDYQTRPGTKHVTVEVEEDMSYVLNLPAGTYIASDEDLIDPDIRPASPPDQKPQVPQIVPVCESAEEMVDDPKKEHLDEVPRQYLLSEELIIDPDERGLINVDDIVSERLHNFTHSQTSTVDEIMKGLNELDPRDKMETADLMEEFAIVGHRNHVSASTEDLMKSLEHFDSELSHPDPNSSLDRDAFDQNAGVEALDFEVLSREFHSNNSLHAATEN